jgi:hypothetical protein
MLRKDERKGRDNKKAMIRKTECIKKHVVAFDFELRTEIGNEKV